MMLFLEEHPVYFIAVTPANVHASGDTPDAALAALTTRLGGQAPKRYSRYEVRSDSKLKIASGRVVATTGFADYLDGK